MFESDVVLVAVADDGLRSFLAEQLTADAAIVHTATDRTQAVARAGVHRPDALVLGELDSAGASLKLLRQIRSGGTRPGEPSADLPVISLVDTSDELAVLRAFHAGADDVVDRDLSYPVLRARLLVMLGRGGSRLCTPTVKIGSLELSAAQRRVWLHGEAVELSGKEYALLATLASDPARVFTRHELLRDVWGFQAEARTRTLDSHASRLRRKLRAQGDELVVNVWGVGYRLVDVIPGRVRQTA